MDYKTKEETALKSFHTLLKQNRKGISLKPKSTGHIIRPRKKKNKLDLTFFNEVISVDAEKRIAEVEGSTSFYVIAEETLKFGLMPMVTPEFRAITIGGAISGLGVESTSFKYGLVHENLEEVTILTPEGKIINCSEKENSDLFHALPNAFGTLGYVLKAKIKLFEVKKYVQIHTVEFNNPKDYFRELRNEVENKENDYLDGVIFSRNEFVIIKGRLVEEAPEEKIPDLYKKPYYEIIQENKQGDPFYLKVKDYYWRWDIDAFWGIDYLKSIRTLTHSALLRKTILKPLLRSDRILQIKKMRELLLETIDGLPLIELQRSEDLVQDAGITIEECAEFFNWYSKKIASYPVWICPVKKMFKSGKYPLYDFPGDFVVDFGFYTKKDLEKGMEKDHYNEMFEEKLEEIDTLKGLYSVNSYTEEEFWKPFDRTAYEKVKNKYDPGSTFPDLYQKITKG